MTPAKAQCASEFVRAAAPVASVQSLQGVRRRMRRWNRWLNERHPYADVVHALDSQEDIDAARLGEYIACSAPLHLTDGWNYLSRAFDAASRGDRYSAYHLAYYAELRAAIALLATEGIGVFNRHHIALDQKFVATAYVGSTHQATWRILSAWSREEGRAARLLSAISLESRSLSEWLGEVGVTDPAAQVVASDWLAAWSLDLRILSSDPARRNEVSYRPTRIRAPASPPVDPQLELVAPLFNSWTALEPSTTDRAGAALDSSLLRQAIALAVDRGLCTYPSVERAVQSLQDSMSDQLYRAVDEENHSATAIFRQAATSGEPARSATPILARGLLMLRLASASTASLLDAAQVSKSDINFWWEALGSDFGLWTRPDEVDRLSDLWADVADAMDEAEERVSGLADGGSVHAVSSILSRNVSLTQFTRAPMWLLGLD